MNSINNKEIHYHQTVDQLRERGFLDDPPVHTIALCYYFGDSPEVAAGKIIQFDKNILLLLSTQTGRITS